MFKLRYLTTVSKSSLVRQIEDKAINYIELLEDVQGINKKLFVGVAAINDLILGLPNYDYLIAEFKKLHATNQMVAENLFRDVYLAGIDCVDSISKEIDSMSQLDSVYNSLYTRLASEFKDKTIIVFKIHEDSEYDACVGEMLNSQHVFK